MVRCCARPHRFTIGLAPPNTTAMRAEPASGSQRRAPYTSSLPPPSSVCRRLSPSACSAKLKHRSLPGCCTWAWTSASACGCRPRLPECDRRSHSCSPREAATPCPAAPMDTRRSAAGALVFTLGSLGCSGAVEAPPPGAGPAAPTELVVTPLADCGHYPMQEMPPLTVTLVERFLAREGS